MYTSHKLLLLLLSSTALTFCMNPTKKGKEKEVAYPAYPLQAMLECDNSSWLIEKSKPLSSELLEESLARAPQHIKGLAALLGNPSLFNAYKPKDLVLKGHYSVGKKTLAQAIAQKSGLNYTEINACWIGNECKKSGEERLLRLVDLSLKTKENPHVMIVRYAERFQERSTPSGETATFWQLLQKCRSNRNIYFILTVEDPSELHHLIAQECTVVPIANPDKATREKVFGSYLKEYSKNTFTTDELAHLADITEGFNFNNLKDLCGETFRRVLRKTLEQRTDTSKLSDHALDISTQDFETTLKKMAERKKEFEQYVHGRDYTTPLLATGTLAAALFILHRIATHK